MTQRYHITVTQPEFRDEPYVEDTVETPLEALAEIIGRLDLLRVGHQVTIERVA